MSTYSAIFGSTISSRALMLMWRFAEQLPQRVRCTRTVAVRKRKPVRSLTWDSHGMRISLPRIANQERRTPDQERGSRRSATRRRLKGRGCSIRARLFRQFFTRTVQISPIAGSRISLGGSNLSIEGRLSTDSLARFVANSIHSRCSRRTSGIRLRRTPLGNTTCSSPNSVTCRMTRLARRLVRTE
jgi:hypothetical protein